MKTITLTVEELNDLLDLRESYVMAREHSPMLYGRLSVSGQATRDGYLAMLKEIKSRAK